MAFKKKNTSGATNNNDSDKAQAFLNVSLTDKHGEVHRLRVGIPLRDNNLLERSLINAARENPNIELKLTGSIKEVVDIENADDIELF